VVLHKKGSDHGQLAIKRCP